MRDYHESPRIRALTQNNARDSRWFAQLVEEDQALFVPIDLHVRAETVQHGASPTAVREALEQGAILSVTEGQVRVRSLPLEA